MVYLNLSVKNWEDCVNLGENWESIHGWGGKKCKTSGEIHLTGNENEYWEIMEIKSNEFSLGILNLRMLTLNLVPLTVGYKNNEITSFRVCIPLVCPNCV